VTGPPRRHFGRVTAWSWRLGAKVVSLGARTRARGRRSPGDSERRCKAEWLLADLRIPKQSDPERGSREKFLDRAEPLHVLVQQRRRSSSLNRAVERRRHRDGLRRQPSWRTFFSPNCYFDRAWAERAARIVNVAFGRASAAERSDFDDLEGEKSLPLDAHLRALKLANILFTYEARPGPARGKRGHGEFVFTPGAVSTPLGAQNGAIRSEC